MLRGKLRIIDDQILETGRNCFFFVLEEIGEGVLEDDVLESEGLEFEQAGPVDACECVGQKIVFNQG